MWNWRQKAHTRPTEPAAPTVPPREPYWPVRHVMPLWDGMTADQRLEILKRERAEVR